MAQLNHKEYDRLERAMARQERVIICRRGTEYVVVPLALQSRNGREVIDARNPTTGDLLSLFVDEVDAIDSVG